MDDVERVDPLIDMPRPYDATDMFGGALHPGRPAPVKIPDSTIQRFSRIGPGNITAAEGPCVSTGRHCLSGSVRKAMRPSWAARLYAKAPSTSETSAVSVINSSIIYNGLPGVFLAVDCRRLNT